MNPNPRTEPAAHAEILPMLRDHLAANIRSVDKEIERTVKKLAELRDKAVTLKQIAVAAGVPTGEVAEPEPERAARPLLVVGDT
jgi:hypothetical protein